MTEPMIQVRGLTKNFWLAGHEIRVLRGIDIDIARRERASITGLSGSGKSTFLHVLGTLDHPSSGRVVYEGQDVFLQNPAQLAAFRNRTIGFVFQFHHLLPEFTAQENVAMPALIQRMSKADAMERASTILASVGLAHRLAHRPGELSGGEQQRVAIARALVLSPPVLLADEPTGNLDERSAAGIHDLLDEMNEKTGLTVILVTHSSRLARRMPRRLNMVDGRLVEVTSGPEDGLAASPEPPPA